LVAGLIILIAIFSDIVIARSIGLLLTVLIMFFGEHFVGLGELRWILPIVVIFGAYKVWNYQKTQKSEFW
jgi:hypothetical protein